MAIYQIDEQSPAIDASAYVAPGAVLIGSVVMAGEASVWFGVVIRADNDQIEIGKGSNVQDNSVLHTDPGYPISIGQRVTVGHSVMLHGCTIGDNSLIGIGSTVMNGAVIGKNCIVGAGSLITEGKSFPDGSLIIGSPAKAIRPLSAEQIDDLAYASQSYIDKISKYQSLKEI
ncbi:MAG: gamma carbonic anhydrase family protein [Acidiferrobacterales bacterium]|nr:gamma carbonic anhydrase family protein [Acidiferrobacterales bacterium]